MIEDILSFVLNTKRPLSVKWLLRYKQTVLGVFKKNHYFNFFQKHPKLFCLYLSNQISLRGRFVFKTNDRISSITSDKDHCCSFFTSWVIKQQKTLYFEKFLKTPNFGRSVHTLKMTTWRKHLILILSNVWEEVWDI